MFKNIQHYFEGTASLEQCFASNEQVNERDLALATCVLMVEVASSDQTVAAEEGKVITDLVHSQFGVPKQEIPILIKMAVKARKEAGKLGSFVEKVANCFDEQQKESVLYMVWRMVLADGHIDVNEEKLVDKLAQYLKLSREQSLEAYQKAINEDRSKA